MLMSWGEFLDNDLCQSCRSVDRKKGFDAVAVDSRKVEKGTLFFALKGERTDGHLYVKDVISAGAVGIVVDRQSDKDDLGQWVSAAGSNTVVWLSDSPLSVLQKAASLYRQRFTDTRFIGVTGSSGKTSCKEILGTLLSTRFKTIVNPGNLNSEIGMPIALFELRPGTEMAVYEMGINRIGEMELLVDLLKPHAVVLTNIGTAHIGMFGSRDKIASEKKKAIEAVRRDGFAVISADDDYVNFLKSDVSCRVLEYGESLVDGFEGVINSTPLSSSLRFQGKELLFSMPGRWNVKNLLAAICCSREMGLSCEEIEQGITRVGVVSGRSEFLEGNISIFNDCYNANPDSMKAGYAFFADWDGCEGKKVAVLGDMGELGEWSSEAHREMGEWVGSKGNCQVIFTGSEMKKAFDAFNGKAGEAFYAGDLDEAACILRKIVQKGDCVLLKGSRSMELERLIPILTK